MIFFRTFKEEILLFRITRKKKHRQKTVFLSCTTKVWRGIAQLDQFPNFLLYDRLVFFVGYTKHEALMIELLHL